MSQSYYTPAQQSNYPNSQNDRDFAAWTLNKWRSQAYKETQSTQNRLPEFAPTSSALFNALGPYVSTPMTTVMTGTASYPTPWPVDHGLYQAGPSVQNSGWPLPPLASPQDNSPTSEPSSGLTTPPNALPYWLPVAQEFWRDPMYAVPMPTNCHPEDPPPAQSRGDQPHEMQWNVYGHSTISHNLLSDEGIEAKHNRSGLPTGAGQPYTSENGTGHYTPYAPQAQRESGDNNASRGAAKGKRKAEDSPQANGDNMPSRKRACRAVPGGRSGVDNKQPFLTGTRPVKTKDGVPLICFTPPVTCNPVPAPDSRPTPRQGQKGNRGRKQPAQAKFQFLQHIGSVDSEGVAKTRKATKECQGYTVDTFHVSLPLAQSATASARGSREMGAERQPSSGKSRAAVEDAPRNRSRAGRSKKLASTRGTATKDEPRAALDTGSLSKSRDTNGDAVYVEDDAIYRWR